MKTYYIFLLTAFAVALVATGSASAGPITGTEVIVVTGDPAPQSGGNFTFVTNPSLNHAGQVAFVGQFSSGDPVAVVRDGPVFGLVELARSGFVTFNDPAINNVGDTAFIARLDGVASDVDDRIFRAGDASLVQLASEGQSVPDFNGEYSSFLNPAFNDAGQVAFLADLTGTSGGINDNRGIFRATDISTHVRIARAGQGAPGGNGSLFSFSRPALNNAGQVAFHAALAGTTGGGSDDSGVYRGDGTTLTPIAREGDAAPDANGTFSGFDVFGPALNDAGQVAFSASLTGTSGGSSDDSGIFRSDGTTITRIARAGEAAPGGNGNFDTFFSSALNNLGQVAFNASLTGTSGGAGDDAGLFRSDGVSTVEIVREGQLGPDGNGTLTNFGSLALNDLGQVAFTSSLAGTSGGAADDNGLFYFDETLGLVQVAREGDALLGSTITLLQFTSSVSSFGDERSGLNNLGQVAYRFELADGREGIALFTVPEPSSLALLALGGLALCAGRRRRTQSDRITNKED